ncbi:MAG: restriction endonuclease subunit S [Nostoc sp.]|uniref:restriction endonuclease subunit S n=1 Tax=Nostoc sp. TaxID=1180 RepID=UPI002FF4C098
MFAVRPDLSYLKSYFLASLMKSSYGRNYFSFTSKQTTNLASTNSTTLKNLKIILPSVDEQTKILNFIEDESAKIQLAIAKIEKEIELIQEYRTTLISDAVTGKIDVRELTHSS